VLSQISFIGRQSTSGWLLGMGRMTIFHSTRILKFTVSLAISESISTTEKTADRSLQLALAAARTAEENRGQDVVVLDMRGITPIFDYFVLATGGSRRQLHAISEEIDHTLEDELGDSRMGIEGYNESRWILLDYGTVVVHLFDEETREYYALEDFWSEAKQVALPWKNDEPTEIN